MKQDIDQLLEPYVSFLLSFKDNIKTYVLENIDDFIVVNDRKATYNNIKLFTELAVDEYVRHLGYYINEIYGPLAMGGLAVALYNPVKRWYIENFGSDEEKEKMRQNEIEKAATKRLTKDIKAGRVDPREYISKKDELDKNKYYNHPQLASGGQAGASW